MEKDEFLASLDEEDAQIGVKVAALDLQLKELLFQRQTIGATRQRYLRFINQKTAPEPQKKSGIGALNLWASEPAKPGSGTRVGPKRRAVLEALAKFTAQGKAATVKMLTAETGLGNTLCYNVAWDGTNKGLVERDDDQYRLTGEGFKLLKTIGSTYGALQYSANTKTPVNPLD